MEVLSDRSLSFAFGGGGGGALDKLRGLGVAGEYGRACADDMAESVPIPWAAWQHGSLPKRAQRLSSLPGRG